MRADGDDRAEDLVDAAQQLDLDLLTRVMALHAGRDDKQPVGADQGGQHACAARQRGRDHRAAHHAQPHPHPVVHAQGGSELAGQPRGDARAPARGGALQLGEQGLGEDVKCQRRGHRVAGRAEHGSAVDSAENHRVAGPDGDAVHGQHPEVGHHPGRVVVAARARAGHDDEQVTAGNRGADRACDAGRVIRLDRQAARLAAGLTRLRGEHERVGVDDLAGAGVRADRPHLVPGRQDGDDRAAPDQQVRGPRRRRGGDVGGPQPVTLGQQQLGGADVLADRAHVLVGRHGCAQLGGAVAVVDVLTHHDRVAPIGHRVPGVDHVVVSGLQVDRRGLTRAEGVGGPDRDPVHAGRVERWRGTGGPYRLGGDQAGRVLHSDPHRRQPGGAARRVACAAPGVQGARGGNVADERAVCHDLR
jgi:hypothetical protein